MNKSWLVAAALLVLLLLPALPTTSAEDENNLLLLDLGNGQVYWSEAEAGSTYAEVIDASAAALGLEVDISNPADISVNGLAATVINGATAVYTNWKIYCWNGSEWVYDAQSTTASRYAVGIAAVGYYADDTPENVICPQSTPDYKTVWTQFGGSSAAYNTSDSYGVDNPALPVEWHRTYTTGYVDSGLIVAGDLLYHTTGGSWGSTTETKDLWIYCLNRFSGDIVWQYHGKYGAGYEVSTPVVVGDMLIVTATCGDIYCFDRYDGTLLHTLTLDYKPPMDEEGTILWDSEIFVTGATTPVYDSGALYFGSADGKVYCYSINYFEGFKEVWCYNPSDAYNTSEGYTGTKGTFYFHAPTIAEIDGQRMLFIGNYGGYLHALNATTGEAVWVKQVVDVSDINSAKPGMPGSAAVVSVNKEGTILLVTCTDGGMSVSLGYILALDPQTGAGYNGEDYFWKINALFTSPVVTDDGFYTYLSPSNPGDTSVTSVDGTEKEIVESICKFDWNGNLVWMCEYSKFVKAPLTLADGVLYAMEYSAGGIENKYGEAGHLAAVDAETGTLLWKVFLEPCTTDSYSMGQATVIEGKIYVGNDYGAVYCLSDVAGPSSVESDIDTLETVGFDHWSWYVLIAVIVMTLTFFFIFYRGA